MTTTPDTYTCEVRTRGHHYRTFSSGLSYGGATWDMQQHLSPDGRYAARVRNERTGKVVARAVPKEWNK